MTHTGTFINDLYTLVCRLEQSPVSNICGFPVGGTSPLYLDSEECGVFAPTWCWTCAIEICPKHAVKFGMETYCLNCGVEAERKALKP